MMVIGDVGGRKHRKSSARKVSVFQEKEKEKKGKGKKRKPIKSNFNRTLQILFLLLLCVPFFTQ